LIIKVIKMVETYLIELFVQILERREESGDEREKERERERTSSSFYLLNYTMKFFLLLAANGVA